MAALIVEANHDLKGTADENVGPGTLLIKYARQASMASLFNYASMAHNNHFYFNCLVGYHFYLVDFFCYFGARL